jgi:pimeloyl-ACP methyl ester carboxylesterase
MSASTARSPAVQGAPSEPNAFSLLNPAGVRISCETWGEGPPLVLLHGAFSDHRTNWDAVKPHLAPHFSFFALARRGRGETEATTGHAIEDEVEDAVALIRRIDAPLFLLGHSYGAHVALAVAARVPDLVRKLVLHEAPWPHLCNGPAIARLEALALAGDWDGFATAFFGDLLAMPRGELEALRSGEDWPSIVADAPASVEDIRAVARYRFDPEHFRVLAMPVLLQVGSESPASYYVTDALAAVLPGAVVEAIAGQSHDAMITAPLEYADAVRRFLLPER